MKWGTCFGDLIPVEVVCSLVLWVIAGAAVSYSSFDDYTAHSARNDGADRRGHDWYGRFAGVRGGVFGRARGGPDDEEIGVVFYEHFGVANHVDGECVGPEGLNFAEALTFEVQTFILAIESDAEFARTGRKRAIEMEGFSGTGDGEGRSGDEALIGEDGEGFASNSGRDLDAERSGSRRSNWTRGAGWACSRLQGSRRGRGRGSVAGELLNGGCGSGGVGGLKSGGGGLRGALKGCGFSKHRR